MNKSRKPSGRVGSDRSTEFVPHSSNGIFFIYLALGQGKIASALQWFLQWLRPILKTYDSEFELALADRHYRCNFTITIHNGAL